MFKWKVNALYIDYFKWSNDKLIQEHGALTLKQFNNLHNISIKDNIDTCGEFEKNNGDS